MPFITKCCLFCLFFLCTFTSRAQLDFLQGQLVDSITGEPVVFATIRIKEKALGVISNQDGGFRLPLKLKDQGDSLIISSMGYEKRRISIHDLSQVGPNSIKLVPGVIELGEVQVTEARKRKRALSAKGIVRRAIKAIPNNFPRYPFSLIGYYRDYQFSEGRYINLNEAILEVFDMGFHKLDNLNTKVQIYDKNENLNFQRDTLSDNKYGDNERSMKIINNASLSDYGGNEFTILRVHDAIRNYNINSYDFVNRLETNLIKNHFFRKQEDTYTEEETLYTIRFTKLLTGYSAVGLLYISKKDFAIHKMKYSVYENSTAVFGKRREIIGNFESSTLVSRMRKENAGKRRLFFEITTEYQRGGDDKMYLNYISFHNDFWLIEPPEFDVNEMVLLRDCQCFEVRFNREVDALAAGNKKNYDWAFKDQKIKFKEVIVFEKEVRLFPDMDAKTFEKMANLLSDENENSGKPNKSFKTEIRNITDKENRYLLGENTYRQFQQYREFFVQRVNRRKEAPKEAESFMNKTSPVFEYQPVSKPPDFGDYWMNTPLKDRF
ncbi:MAG: carboxypeptidase-like regulatory domain-containing protein [Bacteroidota bacterium]